MSKPSRTMGEIFRKRRCTKCQRMKFDEEFEATESQCKKCRARAVAKERILAALEDIDTQEVRAIRSELRAAVERKP